MLSASSRVVSFHLISGQFSNWFGTRCSAIPFSWHYVRCLCNMVFAEPVYLVIKTTPKHMFTEICKPGPQCPPFLLFTWSASGFRMRMAISTVNEHDVHTNHKMATTNDTTNIA